MRKLLIITLSLAMGMTLQAQRPIAYHSHNDYDRTVPFWEAYSQHCTSIEADVFLKDGEILLAIGNSDVPVGQYTQKIFEFYGIDEDAIADKLTYGSNVKEVTTQVSENSVDCGIIYGTDAFSAGLTVVDEATVEMCGGQVIYPAAVLKTAKDADAANAFLDYLKSDACSEVFSAVGFTPIKE